jgi:hypothetical protein
MTVRSMPNAGDRRLSTASKRGEAEPKRDERIAAGHSRRKRGLPSQIAAAGAPRGARRLRQRRRSHRFALFGAPPPQTPGAIRAAARRTHVWS